MPTSYRTHRKVSTAYRLFPRLLRAFCFSSASFFRSASQRTFMEAITTARSRTGKSKNLDGSQPHFCKQK